jgi:hypothetical protein
MEDTLYLFAMSSASATCNPTQFVNNLVQTIPTHGYKIALQSLFIDSKFKGATPKILKVRLEEVRHCLSGNGHHKDIAMVSDKKLKTPPFFYSAKRKEYFDFLEPSLSKLTVSIVDECNKPVQLEHGQPTIISFRLQKLTMASNILRIGSKESSSIFDDNTLSSFRVLLREPLNVTKSMEVALSSVYIPHKIDVPLHIKQQGGLRITLCEENEEDIAFAFEDNSNLSTDTVMTAWSQFLRSKSRKASTIMDTIRVEKLRDGQWVVYTNKTEEAKLRLRVSKMCATLFNIHDCDAESNGDVIVSLKQGDRNMQFNNLKLDRCYPSLIFLHCNFVGYTFAGNRMCNLLKMIPFRENGNKKDVANDEMLLKYEPANYEFLPVCINDNNLLHFEFRTMDGHLAPFQNNPTAEILLNLILRAKLV